MSVLQRLALPWMAYSLRARRLIALGLLLAALALAVGFAPSSTPDAGRLRLLHGLAIFNAILWAIALPHSLLLANAAHRLHLPALKRQALISIALHAALTIALPAMLLALAGGSVPVALTELALGAGIGMAYATLPYWLGILACFTPLLGSRVGAWLPLPATDPSGFLHWAAPLAAVLWALIALGWRQGVRSNDDTPHWLSPGVMHWRKPAGSNSRQANRETAAQAWHRPRQPPGIDLRRTGPAHAVGSLRVALGGWAMPQTLASRLRQLGKTLLRLLLVGTVLLVAYRSALDPAHAAAYGILLSLFAHATTVAFGLGVFGVMLGFTQADALRARWCRANAEPAVLALLPALGDAAHARRAVLRASLLPTLAVQAALFAGIVAMAIWRGLPATPVALLLTVSATALFATFALGVSALGGTALRPGRQSLLTIAASVLMITTCAAALFRFGDHVLADHLAAAMPFALLWAALIASLLRLAHRGWHAFQRRPHPFLPVD